MKKSVLALLVVGLVSLTGCDTIPGVSETTPPTVESSVTDPTPVSSDSTPVTPVTSDSTPVSVDTEPGGETSSSTDGGDEGGDVPSGPTTGTIDQIWLNLQIMGIDGNYTVNTLFQDETTEDYFAVDKGYAWLNTEEQGYALATSWEGGDKKVAYTVTKAETGDTYQLGGPVYTQNPITGAVEDLTDLNDINYLHEIGDTSLVATDYLEQTEDGKVITKNQDLIDDLLWASAAYEAAPTAQDAALFTQAEFGFTEAGDLTVTFTPDTSTSGQIYWGSASLDPTKPTVLTFKDIEGTQVSGIEAAVSSFSLPAALDTTSTPVFIDDESATLSFTVSQNLYSTSNGQLVDSGLMVTGTTSWSDSAMEIYSDNGGEVTDWYVKKGDQNQAYLLEVDALTGELHQTEQTGTTFDYWHDIFTPVDAFNPAVFRADGETGKYDSYSAAETSALVEQCTGYTFGTPFVNSTLTASQDSTVIEASTDVVLATDGYQYYLMQNTCTITVTATKDGDFKEPTAVTDNTAFDTQYITGKLDGTVAVKAAEDPRDGGQLGLPLYNTYYDTNSIIQIEYEVTPSFFPWMTGQKTITSGSAYYYDQTDSKIEYYDLTPTESGGWTVTADSEYDMKVGSDNDDDHTAWKKFFKDWFFPYNTGIFEKIEDDTAEPGADATGLAAEEAGNEDQTEGTETAGLEEYGVVRHAALVQAGISNLSPFMFLLSYVGYASADEASFLMTCNDGYIQSITIDTIYAGYIVPDTIDFTYGDGAKDNDYQTASQALYQHLGVNQGGSTGGTDTGAEK